MAAAADAHGRVAATTPARVDRAARPQRCCDHRRGPRERDFAKARLAHHTRRAHATPLVDALRAGALSVTTGTVAHCSSAS
jgi:hypothetical protein